MASPTHATSSERPPIDLCYLNDLDASALLPLIALEARTDLHPAFRDRVQSIRASTLARLQTQVSNGGWSALGARRLAQAKQTLAMLPPRKLRDEERNCDGSVVSSPMPVSLSPAEATAPMLAPSVNLVPAPNEAHPRPAKPTTALTGERRQ